MRRTLICLLIFSAAALLLPAPEAQAAAPPRVNAAAAIVTGRGGEAVFELRADEPRLIASTTKLLTALLAAERLELGARVEIRPEWTGVEGSSMYLRPGETRTVRELLEGLLLASGNDAARALACLTAGSEESFALLMNLRARELGMTRSHFVNPHGLDAPGHAASARDLACLMEACLENDALAALLTERSAQIGEQTFVNHNKLLTLCPGCLGGKTGYTEAAGRCLVSACEREGTRLICVTLHDTDDWIDHQRLYNWAFSQFAERDVAEQARFEVPVVSGDRALLPVEARALRLFLPRDAELTLVAHLPRFVFAPIAAGESAGRLEIFRSGERIGETELFFAAGAEKTVQSFQGLSKRNYQRMMINE